MQLDLAELRRRLATRSPLEFTVYGDDGAGRAGTTAAAVLIPVIAQEYGDLVDQVENRMHANVTLAQEASEKTRKMIADRLSQVFNKTVVPHVTVDSRIIGGIVVRVGDKVMDGSVRRRLGELKHRMLGR